MTAAAAAASITAALIVFCDVFARGRADGDAAFGREIDGLVASAATSARRWRLSRASSAASRSSCASRSAAGELERVAELALAGEQVHRPGGGGRLAQRLQPRGEVAVGGGPARCAPP